MFKRNLKSFQHGVHPPEQKLTRDAAIKQFPFAPLLSVPLSQHIGQAAVPVVREGETVQRGQTIAEPDGHFSVAMHAPATGQVKRIALMPGIAGKMVPGIYIEPHPGSTQTIHSEDPCDLEQSTPEEIIQAVQRAGIVGLGGAAFPTHIKLEGALKGRHHTLVINGVECEPFLTTDHRVMLEHADDIMTGVRYLLNASGADQAILGVEANKMDAVAVLREACPPDLPLTVEALEVKYPQGAEKMLVKAVTERKSLVVVCPLILVCWWSMWRRRHKSDTCYRADKAYKIALLRLVVRGLAAEATTGFRLARPCALLSSRPRLSRMLRRCILAGQ